MSSSRDFDRYRKEAAEAYAANIADQHAALDQLGSAQLNALQELALAVMASWQDGGKLLVCGNGGSAADSQHLVAELVGRFQTERPAFPAIALTVNSSILTSVSNDYSFAEIFSRQVEALGKPGDVLLVISTSGESENCRRAVVTAQTLDISTHGLLGHTGGSLATEVGNALVAPGATTARIQEVHLTLEHLLCDLLERWQTARLAGSGEDDV